MEIEPKEIILDFKRSSGPGGQNVNKVSTAVELRFDIAKSKSISEDTKQRLARIAQGRISKEGILILVSQVHRTQEKNKKEVIKKFLELIEKAAKKAKKRIFCERSLYDKNKRLDSKKMRSEIKKMRGKFNFSD